MAQDPDLLDIEAVLAGGDDGLQEERRRLEEYRTEVAAWRETDPEERGEEPREPSRGRWAASVVSFLKGEQDWPPRPLDEPGSDPVRRLLQVRELLLLADRLGGLYRVLASVKVARRLRTIAASAGAQLDDSGECHSFGRWVIQRSRWKARERGEHFQEPPFNSISIPTLLDRVELAIAEVQVPPLVREGGAAAAVPEPEPMCDWAKELSENPGERIGAQAIAKVLSVDRKTPKGWFNNGSQPRKGEHRIFVEELSRVRICEVTETDGFSKSDAISAAQVAWQRVSGR